MPDKDCCPEDIRKPVSVPTLLTQTALKVNKTKTGLIPDPA